MFQMILQMLESNMDNLRKYKLQFLSYFTY